MVRNATQKLFSVGNFCFSAYMSLLLIQVQGSSGSTGYAATGNHLSVTAGRLAYTFAFGGPAVVIDTACSSSLVAIGMASVSICSGKVENSLCGGINLCLSPSWTSTLCAAGMMAPDMR